MTLSQLMSLYKRVPHSVWKTLTFPYTCIYHFDTYVQRWLKVGFDIHMQVNSHMHKRVEMCDYDLKSSTNTPIKNISDNMYNFGKPLFCVFLIFLPIL